ncbi:MAG: glycosyltransferase [Cyanobacteria bacterium P01_G01_bin.54]
MTHSLPLPTTLDDIALPPELPPLVITAFARPDLLSPVLTSIQHQSLLPPKIIAFVDGPRTHKDQPLIQACIQQFEEFAAVVPVEIIARPQNLGCDRNVLQAFTEVFQRYEALVYLEDDDRPNPYFYDRLCRLLIAYQPFTQVCSVSSYATLPEELTEPITTDFFVSRRCFSWGFGTWRDRWQQLDLPHHPPQYNPFGYFYQIPATAQTKRTLINQFWLEKNRKTDWVITFTIAAFYHQKIHIIPQTSFICNIGFGHAQSETYSGAEQAWVNARYQEDHCPDRLPPSLDLLPPLQVSLSTVALVQYLSEQEGFWLNGAGLFYLLKRADSWWGRIGLLRLFVVRLPILIRRWRSGLPT